MSTEKDDLWCLIIRMVFNLSVLQGLPLRFYLSNLPVGPFLEDCIDRPLVKANNATEKAEDTVILVAKELTNSVTRMPSSTLV